MPPPGRLGWLLAAASSLACALPVPHAVALLPLAVTFLWTPGALMASSLAPGSCAQRRALLALALSPALAGAAAAVLLALGASPALAARLVAVAIAVGSLAAAARAGGAARDRAGAREPWAAPVAALLWAALCAALLLGNPSLPARSDGWFHAAVTRQIAERGLPPEDPFFAGLRLLYFWGEHAWAALWLALEPGLTVWIPLVALNLSAAFACLLGVGLLARRLGAPPGGEVLAAALAVGGAAPFAWGAVAARAATGTVRGPEEVRRLVGLGADPALQILSPGLLHASMAFLGDKFLVLTPFSAGLALFTAFLLLLLDLAEPGERALPPRRAAPLLAAVIGAALFLHTVVGYVCAALTLAWTAWSLTARPDAALRARLLAAAVGTGAALLLSAPYLIAITAGKRSPVGLSLDPRAAWTLLWGGLLVVPVGAAWLRGAARREAPLSRAAGALLGLGAALACVALLLRLPESNQSKFFNLLFLLLSAPAALGWLELLGRVGAPARLALAATLALAALPTVALCLWGFASERGEGPESLPRATASEREAARWAALHLPAPALLVDRLGVPDLPVETGRSLLWGGGRRPRDWGYPPAALELRRRASIELSGGGSLSPDARALLGSLGREVVVVERARNPLADPGESGSRAPFVARPGDSLLWRNEAMAFHRLGGAR